jgi:hypothetical protein
MSYYQTLEEDVARAKELLEKGRLRVTDLPVLISDELRAAMLTSGGHIYGADTYAAYKLLQSFVEVIEAVGPKVCELALRHEQKRATETITCPHCGRVSHSPADIRERYCGACHRFHNEEGRA